MIWKFPKRLNVRVHVERDGRLGMPEPTREFDGTDALLVPKGGAPVSQGMWAEPTGVEHGGAETVATNWKRETPLECVHEFLWNGDESAPTLTLARLAAHPELRISSVVLREFQRLTNPEPTELHHQHRQDQVVAEAGE